MFVMQQNTAVIKNVLVQIRKKSQDPKSSMVNRETWIQGFVSKLKTMKKTYQSKVRAFQTGVANKGKQPSFSFFERVAIFILLR